jgi:hypothetical protein
MEELNIKLLAKNFYNNRLNFDLENVEKLFQDIWEKGFNEKLVPPEWGDGEFIEYDAKILSNHSHYDNSNGSLYKFAEDHKLNAWEFDIVKRVVRCRKKGQFEDDLKKTKDVIDLYLKEYGD